MLRASMIDGFGWFEKVDYRRSWLLFDDVDYIWPVATRGPFVLPAEKMFVECTVIRPSLAREALAALVEAARADAASPPMRDILVTVPKQDLEYAQSLVWSDVEIASVVGDRPLPPDVSLMFLVNKLLVHASETGSVPMVGREYASRIVQTKLQTCAATFAPSARLSTLKQHMQYACISAGLAFGFVDDEVLVKTPMSRLIAFKEKNARLLDRNQVHLLDIAQQYAALSGSQLEDKIVALRTEGQKKRVELEEDARQLWLSAGLDVAKKSVVAASASSGLLTAIALVQHASLSHVAFASVPAAAAAATALIDVARSFNAKPRTPMAYLLSARHFLERS
jgi:hypothetical protein